MYFTDKTDFLAHYGVIGMKWGVRHDRKTGDINIKKGTHFKRLSVYDESKAKGHAYVNYRKDDINRYKGFFAARLRAMNPGKDVKSIDLISKKKMRAPGKQTRINTFKEMQKNDPRFSKELAKYHKSDWHYFTPLPTKYYEVKIKNLKNNKMVDYGYKHFVRAIGGNEYIRSEYFKRLSKKGYDFVTDDMDAGRFGKEPSIIFDRNKSTKYGGSTLVTKNETKKLWKKYGTYIKK